MNFNAQTFNLPAAYYVGNIAAIRYWQFPANNRPVVNEGLTGGSSRTIRRIGIHDDGEVELTFSTGQTDSSIGNDLSSTFELSGSATFVAGGISLQANLAGADVTEPYSWIPDNSAEAIAFFNALSDTNGSQAGTLTLRDFAPVAEPVTINADTIAAEGVQLRALITVGNGGADKWYSRFEGEDIGEATGDLELPGTIPVTRFWLVDRGDGTHDFRINQDRPSAYNFSTWATDQDGDSKSVCLIVGDNLVEIPVTARRSIGPHYLNLTPTPAQAAILDGVVAGDLVNIVIGDAGTCRDTREVTAEPVVLQGQALDLDLALSRANLVSISPEAVVLQGRSLDFDVALSASNLITIEPTPVIFQGRSLDFDVGLSRATLSAIGPGTVVLQGRSLDFDIALSRANLAAAEPGAVIFQGRSLDFNLELSQATLEISAPPTSGTSTTIDVGLPTVTELGPPPRLRFLQTSPRRLLDAGLVDGGGAAYFGNLQLYFDRDLPMGLRIAEDESESFGAAEPSLTDAWEISPRALVLSAGGEPVEIPGPLHPSNQTSDTGTEPYDWLPSAAKVMEIRAWMVTFMGLSQAEREATTLTFDDGVGAVVTPTLQGQELTLDIALSRANLITVDPEDVILQGRVLSFDIGLSRANLVTVDPADITLQGRSLNFDIRLSQANLSASTPGIISLQGRSLDLDIGVSQANLIVDAPDDVVLQGRELGLDIGLSRANLITTDPAAVILQGRPLTLDLALSQSSLSIFGSKVTLQGNELALDIGLSRASLISSEPGKVAFQGRPLTLDLALSPATLTIPSIIPLTGYTKIAEVRGTSFPRTGLDGGVSHDVILRARDKSGNLGNLINAGSVVPTSFAIIGGVTWLSGADIPADDLGEDGNFYFRTQTGDIYRKEAGSWILTTNLSDTTATWRSGTDAPNDSLGNDGDFYFRTSNAAIYEKVAGAWVFRIDIDGEDGATWHSVSGIPPSDLGEVGDWAFRTDQGYVYEKTGTSTWTFRTDLTGPQGINGATWHTGVGVPPNSLGSDDDFYFRTSNNTVYEKTNGVWAVIADLSGADGATWHTGSGAPSNNLGNDDDWYFRTGTGALAGSIYRKVSGAWVKQVDIDQGVVGATWHSGSGVPSNSLGVVGDWYFRTSNGFVYEKTGSSTWTFRRDITGPQGINGTVWHSGSGAPSNTLGNDGDFYLRTSNNNAYRKDNGVWSVVVNFSGADGATWFTGSTEPNNSLGQNGDWYFQTGTGPIAATIYRKISGAWVSQIDLDQGSTGEDGAVWHSGSGVPASSLGVDGDWYFRTSNGFVYEKTTSTVWTFRRDITGPQGEQGIQGPQGIGGATWHTGVGAPDNSLGSNTDLYFRTDNNNVYHKANDVWTVITDLSGADGANWFTGTTVPANNLGSNGDWYFRTATATIYRKSGGTWSIQVDIDGEDGAVWHSGTGIPANNLGITGDWYFRTSNGFVYEKTSSTVWTFRRDITGPQGDQGEQGEQGPQGIGGATWHFGSGAPSNSLGDDTDLYLRTSNNNVYRKASGSWSVITDLSGADGATWYTGSGAPSSSLGQNGDWYFRTSNANIYRKAGGSWSVQVDIDAEDGSVWHSGSGVPSSSLGAINDWYFRTSNGFVYEKTSSFTWTFRRDITGPQGEQGINGATWHSGTTAPSSSLGSNGDFYLRTSNNTVYQKASGSWSVITDLSGADGATWHSGSGVPSSSLGDSGDWYFRTSNANIYRKTGSTWFLQIDIDGEDGDDGSVWHSGSGVPSSSLGVLGDWYFRTSNGFVYEKISATIWTFRRDITGPQGPEGPAANDGAGFEWQGTWVGSGSYSGGSTATTQDVVAHEGKSYVCILSHTGFSFREPGTPTGAPYWDLLADQGGAGPAGDSFSWQGNWASVTNYALRDNVAHDGRSYICILAHFSLTSRAPGTAGGNAYWDLLADKGDPGEDATLGTGTVQTDNIALSATARQYASFGTPSGSNQLDDDWETLLSISAEGGSGYQILITGIVAFDDGPWELRLLRGSSILITTVTTSVNTSSPTQYVTAAADHPSTASIRLQGHSTDNSNRANKYSYMLNVVVAKR